MASVPCTRTCNPLTRGLSHPGKKKKAEGQSGHPSNKETGLKEKCDVGLCLEWYRLAQSCNMMHSASC